ncbi:MAG: PadR family transcriptional regulator [Micropepsaceae bacterium]
MTTTEVHLKKFRKELHSGIAAMVLLALLDRTGDEMYGYQIAKEIGAKAGGASFLKQGAIYPVLRSLHAAGMLSSRVEVSVSGPPRRYYTISAEGREALLAWREVWGELRSFVDALIEQAPGERGSANG